MVRVRERSEEDFRAWLAAGDCRRAAEALVHWYGDEVIGLCAAMVRDRMTAEDLAQDSFSHAFSGLPQFRREASSRTWLLRIARNRCIDHLRARQRDPWGGGTPEDIEPDDQPDEAPLPFDLLDRRRDVETALDELVEGDRALIVLRFRNGLDYKELALAFGIKEGTARMRINRALARMRRALEAVTVAEEMELSVAESSLDSMVPASAPAPMASRSRAAPPQARRRFAAGIKAFLGDVMPPPSAPSPPVEHSLTAFFAATHHPLSARARERLLTAAGGL